MYLLPPVLVWTEMTPDCALPNSAEEEPVVTDASSSALVPRLISVPAEPDVVAAPVAGGHRNAVDVGDGFVGAATADRERVVGGARHDTRLEGQHVVKSVDRQIAGKLTVDPLLGGHLVSRAPAAGSG